MIVLGNIVHFKVFYSSHIPLIYTIDKCSYIDYVDSFTLTPFFKKKQKTILNIGLIVDRVEETFDEETKLFYKILDSVGPIENYSTLTQIPTWERDYSIQATA